MKRHSDVWVASSLPSDRSESESKMISGADGEGCPVPESAEGMPLWLEG